jgi:Copper type II ascorbate-dependent monooxygenase, C-terminal domain
MLQKTWLVLLLLGCGAKQLTGQVPDTSQTVVTWAKDIEPLISSRCAVCHQTGGIGTIPLVTLDQVRMASAAVRNSVVSGRMPPWPASAACNTYAPDGSLSEVQKQQLVGWIDDGMPEGSTPDTPPARAQALGLSRVDLTVNFAEAYTPTKSPDEYRCFILDWPEQSVKYITGFNVKAGEPSLVHHANLFFVSPKSVATFEARDAATLGYGYECYTVPTPFNAELGWIGTFVPGSLGADFPGESGLKIEPGSKLLLQVHYNISQGAKADRSSVQFSLTDRVNKVGTVQAWANPLWISQKTMRIPANDADVVHRFELDPTQFASVLDASFTDGQPLYAWMGTMHMHQLGRSAKLEVRRKAGNAQCVVDIPQWNFDWQLPYTLQKPVTIFPGDTLAVECHWNNSQQNQRQINGVQQQPKEVNWGVNTEDEMCVGGVYFTQ